MKRPVSVINPRTMYKFLEDRRMYSLDETLHIDLEASAKAADELQALWLVKRTQVTAEMVRAALFAWRNFRRPVQDLERDEFIARELNQMLESGNHLQCGQAVTPSGIKK